MKQQPIIIALDFPDAAACECFLKKFPNESLFLKVGMELFFKEGRSFVEQLAKQGHRIFLDLKLADIPQTVYRAIKSLKGLPLDYLTVHTSGGFEMLKSAQLAATEIDVQLLGVTILTSLNEMMLHQELNIQGTLQDVVLHRANIAKKAGISGVIASAHEAECMRKHVGDDFLIVTPGIRLATDSCDDQQRVMTPIAAITRGASQLVIGRSITKAMHPADIYQDMLKQIVKE